MNLRTVLTIAALAACLRPAVAMAANLPLQPADLQTSQTPAQVFVRASGDSVRGVRPEDDPNQPLFNAAGAALLFTLDKWRAGNGTIDITPDPEGNGDRVTLDLRRLIAFGHYSVFIRTDGPNGPQFAPLDGSGLANNFDAHEDGSANVTISSPQHLSSGTWIVTIYHSDAQDHGNVPGDLTRTAQQQLIARVP